MRRTPLSLERVGESAQRDDVRGDVVFVHGLGGDPADTWQARGATAGLIEWVAADRDDLVFWTLKWAVAGLRGVWPNVTEALVTIATEALAYLSDHGLGRRPLCFVTHSMGGLLVKQMLLLGAPDYAAIPRMTRGVVFIATPHAGAALAKVIRAFPVLKRSMPLAELDADTDRLADLNNRYRAWAAEPGRIHRVYFERQRLGFWRFGQLIVDRTSADPGLHNVTAIGVDADHSSIVKPIDQSQPIVAGIRAFLDEAFAEPQAPPKPEPPRLVFTLRDEGEQPSRNGPQRVVALVAENRGSGTVGEFIFQMQVPFLPPDVSQPIAPDRVIRPLVAAERDGGQGWKNWKYWHTTEDGRRVLGITVYSFGEIKLFRPMELILCHFRMPVGWFSQTPRPTTYRCPYALTYPPDAKEEGVLPLDLFELVEGYY